MSMHFMSKRAKELGLVKQDAKEALMLVVKPIDVASASKKDPTCCGFAQACKRTKKADAAWFFRSTAWLQKGKKLLRYLLPESMTREIISFDRNHTMEPGTYRLAPPPPSQTLGAIRKEKTKYAASPRKGEGKGKGTKQARQFRHRSTDVRGFSAN